jgi:hypothetical protein
MQAPTYYRGGDDESLVPTGETTTINAAAGEEVIEILATQLMCDHGRYEQPDYESVEAVLTKHGLIDEDFRDEWDDEDEV